MCDDNRYQRQDNNRRDAKKTGSNPMKIKEKWRPGPVQ